VPLRRHVNAFDEQAEILASLDVGVLWERMLGEFLGEFVRLERRGLPAAEMERELRAFLDGLSERPVADLARQSAGVAYNQGRAAEILTAAAGGAVQYVVRSAVLDQSTCEECARLDGAVVEVGTPEFRDLMPPARCLGGDRCRCFYIPVGDGVA
jgi:SPP1 gp7 family putative phage head morphogenesis protein